MRTTRELHSGLLFLWRYASRDRILFVVIVLLVAVVAGLQLLAAPTLGRLVDVLMEGSSRTIAVQLGVRYGGLGMALLLVGLLESWITQTVAWRATNAMRSRLVDAVIGRPGSYFDDTGVGELIERVDGDVSTLFSMISSLFARLGVSLLMLLGAIVYAFSRTDWRMGILFVATTIFSAGALRATSTWATGLWQQHRTAVADLTNYLGESLDGIYEIVANGVVGHRLRGLTGLNSRALSLARRATVRITIANSVSRFLFVVATGSALVLGDHLVLAGAMTVGSVFATVRLLDLIMRPLEAINQQAASIAKALASTSRIESLLEGSRPASARSAGTRIRSAPGIALEAVSFTYADGTVALSDISFELPRGTSLGIAGATGSGESTLLSLLSRINPAEAGSVTLDGVDIGRYAAEEFGRSVISVGQSPWVFHGTVRDNIRIFADADDAELEHLVRRLRLDSWISALSCGLDTQITPDNLSRGEQRLIAVARAFVSDPPVVLLDEPTGGLDGVTATNVAEASLALCGGRTTAIASHDLGLLDRMDNIVVLAGGRIDETGSPLTLKGQPGSAYSRMISARVIS